MLIKMKRSEMGSPNGISVMRYNAGEEYEVTDSLGEVFIKMGVAEKMKSVPSNKDAGAASKNKAESAPVEDEDQETEDTPEEEVKKKRKFRG